MIVSRPIEGRAKVLSVGKKKTKLGTVGENGNSVCFVVFPDENNKPNEGDIIQIEVLELESLPRVNEGKKEYPIVFTVRDWKLRA